MGNDVSFSGWKLAKVWYFMGFFMGEENAGESKWSPWRWDCDFNGVDAMGGE